MFRNKKLLGLILLLLGFAACKDSGSDTGDKTNVNLEVETQGTQNGNQLLISSVTADEAGWVVIHRDNGNDAPQVPDIIGKVHIDPGTTTDIMLPVDFSKSVANGEKLWAMLHADNGTAGKYEFDGSENSYDPPVTSNNQIVMQQFTIQQTDPAVMTTDQVNRGGVFVTDVDAAEDGWIVIHRDNGNDGPEVPPIIGKARVSAGTNQDVYIPLNDGETVQEGEKLWTMLHYDTGTKGKYEFTAVNDSPDQPVFFDGNIVTTQYQVKANNSTVSAMDQVNQGGEVVADITSDTDGWVVIHRDNGMEAPQVPAIIGKAKISKGDNANTHIKLTEDVQDGDKLWAMVHYDTGELDTYEFDGAGTPDQPVINGNGDIVMQQFSIQANTSTLSAMDQVPVDNMLTVTVDAATDGWVVVHRDNGMGAPKVPPIIGKAQIHEGLNTDVQIPLDSTLADGEKVWPMVHFDTGVEGEYEFEGSGTPDQPMIVNGAILTTSITVSGTTPKVTVSDQALMDGSFTINGIDARNLGFIVLHKSNADGSVMVPESIGHARVYAGANNEVKVMLDDNANVQSGDKIWAMLHIDSRDKGMLGKYEFDGTPDSADPPVFDASGNIVMKAFIIQ